MRNLITPALALFSLIGFTGAANAQLASQTTQFNGTVPAVCQVADPVNASTPMAFNNNVLSGQTNAFSFQSNGNVALQLRAVNIVGAPEGAGNYNWAAGLKVNNGNQLAQATQNDPSSAVPFVNGLTANDDFQMTLSITAPGSTLLAQGNYIALVTTDCIAN